MDHQSSFLSRHALQSHRLTSGAQKSDGAKPDSSSYPIQQACPYARDLFYVLEILLEVYALEPPPSALGGGN